MPTKKKSSVPNLPDGWFDIVPEDQKYWYHVWRKANGLLGDYSFSRLDLAPAELSETLTRPVSSSEPDASGGLVVSRVRGLQIALRSDMPSSMMRAYLQHNMHSLPPPVKMFTNGPIVGDGLAMRWQLAVTTIGDDSEAVDAELLFLGCRILEGLGIGAFTVRINTIGDALARPAYHRALREFFKTHAKKIGAKTLAAAKEHPFLGLAALGIENPDIAKDAPQSVDFLSDASRTYFKRLLEFLDEGQVPYVIDHTLLTTADSASHTIWEFIVDPFAGVPAVAPTIALPEGTPGLPPQASQVVIRGGRMDRMAELLGGPKTPASGWTLDLDSVVTRLRARGTELPDPGARPKVFLSQLGDAAKKRSLMLFEEIRKSGIEVRYSLSRDTIKGQLRMAARFGVRFALIFGQKEALEGTVILREMETGIQETIPQEKIIDELKKRLRTK